MPNDEIKNKRAIDNLISQFNDDNATKIWRGFDRDSYSSNKANSICTGYKSINKQLHGNGWPIRSTVEFGINQTGIGELRLLLPALKKLQSSRQNKEIILISPPHIPFAPALKEHGIDLTSITIVNAPDLKQRLWANEQSLMADCCAAVISWYGDKKINHHELRRLQIATEESSTWNVLFRHNRCLEEPSSSGLRIHLNSTSYSKLQLDIIKQPNGWGGQRCIVSMAPHYENWQRIATALLPINKFTENRQTSVKQATVCSTSSPELSNLEPSNPEPSNKEITEQKLKALRTTKNTNTSTVSYPKSWQCKVSIITPISTIQDVH